MEYTGTLWPWAVMYKVPQEMVTNPLTIQPMPQAGISHIAICNPILRFISSSGPHKDIDDFVRLHVVVGLVTTS